MAARLARVDVYGATYLARQLRAFIPLGLLEPRGYHGKGRTAHALFDDYSLCQARLLCILARVPLLRRQLEVAAQHMQALASADIERLSGASTADLPPPAALAHAVDGVRNGEAWWFRLHPWPMAPDDEAVIAGTPYADAQATMPSDGTMAILSGGFTTARCGAFDSRHPSPVTLDFDVAALWAPLLALPDDTGDDDTAEEPDA